MGDIIDIDTREKLSPEYFCGGRLVVRPAVMIKHDVGVIMFYGEILSEITEIIEDYHPSANALSAVKKDGYWTVTIEKVD